MFLRLTLGFTSLVLAAIATAAPLSAQRLNASRTAVRYRESPSTSSMAVSRPQAVASPREQSTPGMVVSGLALGAVGMLAGGAAGFWVEDNFHGSSCSDLCGLGGLLIGAFIGESFGLATGVHVAGGRRGSLVAEMAVSLLASVVGVFAVVPAGGAGLVIAPPLQLFVTISMERSGAARSQH